MSGGQTGSVATPATPVEEPLTVAEVMSFCQIDESNQEPAPTELTAALASPAVAGNVTAGAHRYRVTFITDDGETEGGTVSAAVTVANAAVNGKVELTAIPIGGALVTSRKIYRTVSAGTEYLLLATIADNTTTIYTDNIADASLGAGCPTTNTTGDPMLSMFIASARQAAELSLGRKLVTQSVIKYLDDFPEASNHILLPPAQSVTSITYTATDGTVTVLSAPEYDVDTSGSLTRIKPAYGYSWPSTRQEINAVTIVYVAGYGARASVPQSIKTWMLLRIRSMYDNRSAHVAGTIINSMPSHYIDGMLDPERVYGRPS